MTLTVKGMTIHVDTLYCPTCVGLGKQTQLQPREEPRSITLECDTCGCYHVLPKN